MVSNIAIFMDRDGTISKEVGYVNHIDRFALLPKAAEAIKLINESGMKAIVITNQAGVAKGYFPEGLIGDIHQKMVRLLKNKGAYLDAVYYCPHHPEATIEKYRKNCENRKPNIGMLRKAAKELEIDLSNSFIIGDKIIDVELAERVDATGIMVLTGYGKGELRYTQDRWTVKPDFIAHNLYEAVNWILCKIRG